ncbi:hypothetical protein S7711_00232 [Stachybotrys chartarum IBT 7711]|uniref:Major facilitator superfamily (MFS) profile domain-containing protein n=1 Tax=Stachybotrys chartarum (strain CBS 109288 / IBT 7711) TaxID=1280523 RepID=A0A084B3V4_STACB|nr:hypothetical protein S7711_00232 [Stachybotrys chartarum IBT 7711]KFA52205.1 hypothetical protein S40293_00628 [Stachybotrys chartarum IBT 40293]
MEHNNPASLSLDPQDTDMHPNPQYVSHSLVDDDFPEGGWRAWGVAGGTAIVFFCTLGYVNSWGLYQAYYMQNQLSNQDPSSIAWIGSLQFWLIFSAGLLGGPLFDRYGAKVMIPGAFMHVLCIMITSISSEYWHFMVVQGVIGGFANGMTLSPAIAATPQYFNKRRGAAMGLSIAGSSIGGVVFPLALSPMLESDVLGFGWAVRVCGFIILGLLVVACFLIKERLPPRKERFFLPKAFLDITYILTISSGFIMYLGMFAPFFFLPDYALHNGMDPVMARYLVAILNGAGFFGRVIPGILSDRFGRSNMYAVAGLTSAILLFCWTRCTTDATIILFTALFGFTSGGIISGFSVSLASLSNDPRNIGTYMGQGATVASIASLIGPPINGEFLSTYGGFNELAIFAGVACLIGTVVVVAAKVTTPKGVLAIS